MRKTFLSAAMASALAVGAVGAAQEKPREVQEPREVQASQAPSKAMRGSITSVDNTTRSFVMKDEASGKEVTVYWTGSTKLNGDLKVGSMVSLETTEQSGRTVATSIDATSAKKPY